MTFWKAKPWRQKSGQWSPGARGGRRGLTVEGLRGTVWGDGNVPYLGNGGSHMSL